MLRVRILIGAAAMVGACALFLSAGGCGSGSKLPPVAVTTGLVTLDGKPLTYGEVAFVPDSSKGSSGPMGTASIGPDGQYEVYTAGERGALVGFHRIQVVVIDDSKPEKPWAIPIDYGYAEKSGLTAEVKADQKNVVNLELKSQK